MMRRASLLLALLLALSPLSGCVSTVEGGAGGKNEVNVFNWGEYIDESLLKDFEAETDIKVNYRTFPDNETLYSTLQNAPGTYDVIIPSDYMIARMIDEDMLETINFDNIPNFSDIDEAYRNLDYDPTNEYSVPYTWGTVGIIYNTTMVDEIPDSWGVLWDSKYSGEILMFDNSRDCIGIALKYLGYSYNTTDGAQITEAVDLLIEQFPLVQAYVMDQIFDKMEVGEAALGPYYAGDALTMMEENSDLGFCLPKEGSNLFVDAMCIPKGAPHKDNAEAFINFMCSAEAAAANCDYIGYSTPSTGALELLDEAVTSDPIAYPSAEVLATCETYVTLPEDILALYDTEWLRLKSSSNWFNALFRLDK